MLSKGCLQGKKIMIIKMLVSFSRPDFPLLLPEVTVTVAISSGPRMEAWEGH